LGSLSRIRVGGVLDIAWQMAHLLCAFKLCGVMYLLYRGYEDLL